MRCQIARITLFLASRQAPTRIGSRIVIDGGLNAQQVRATWWCDDSSAWRG